MASTPITAGTDTQTDMNQKPVKFGTIPVFVPDGDKGGPAPELFLERHKQYTAAKVNVIKRIKSLIFPIKLLPSWSPAASWGGLAVPSKKFAYINLAYPKWTCEDDFYHAIFHEVAHHKTGDCVGHCAQHVWEMGCLYSAYMKAGRDEQN